MRISLCLALMAFCSVGCAGKPSEAECDAFADHLVVLLKQAHPDSQSATRLAGKQKEKLIDKCVIEGTKAEVECVLASASLDAVAADCK
jgi:hypothetical protein